jgi:hypothetical protein
LLKLALQVPLLLARAALLLRVRAALLLRVLVLGPAMLGPGLLLQVLPPLGRLRQPGLG